MGSNQSVKRYDIKTTSNGRRPHMEDDLLWKMTSKMKIKISQQPLVGSYSNLKLKLMGSTRVYKGIILRQPPIEDELRRKMTSKYEK
jgi:hypothetical protein